MTSVHRTLQWLKKKARQSGDSEIVWQIRSEVAECSSASCAAAFGGRVPRALGDRTVLREVRALLTRPSLLDDFGDLAGHALDALVFMAAGDNLAIAIGVRKIFFPVIAHYWTAPSA